jgi:hypothetical protein
MIQILEEQIGEIVNITNENSVKAPWRQAIEDAIVVFAFTGLSTLVAIGWPPAVDTCYVPMLSAGLVGTMTYMKARGITRR